MSIHEECGVFGVYSQRQEDVASLAYYGLYSLQHRGQEGCGIVVNDDGVFDGRKGLGLVSEVFTGSVMKQFPTGKMPLPTPATAPPAAPIWQTASLFRSII